jgi:hypothetical protein
MGLLVDAGLWGDSLSPALDQWVALGDPCHSVRRQGKVGAGAVDPLDDDGRLQVAKVCLLELGSGVGGGPGGSEDLEQVGEPVHEGDGTDPVLRPADPTVPNR